MRCRNCNAEVAEGSLFCTNCGSRISSNEPVNQNVQVQFNTGNNGVNNMQTDPSFYQGNMGVEPPFNNNNQNINKKNSLKKGKIIAAVIAILAIIVVGFVGTTAYMEKDRVINLNDYVGIKLDGSEHNGYISYYYDTDKFEKDYGKKLDNKQKLKEYSYVDAADMIFELCVSGSFDKSENLSNGDKVKFSWECDDKLVKTVFGYTLKYSDIEYEVKDLPETINNTAKDIDVFENIRVEYAGKEPFGEARIVNENSSSSYLCYLHYSIDKDTDLSNGDTVTVTFDDASRDDIAELIGGIPKSTTKEFKVEGLSYYAKTYDDIPESTKEKMINAGLNKVKENTATYNEYTSYVSATYAGNYFFRLKEKSSYYNNNIVYMIYAVTVNINNPNENLDKTEVYYTSVMFEDVLIDSEGKATVDCDDIKMPIKHATFNYYEETSEYTTYTFDGYNDIAGAFEAIIGYNFKLYEYDDNIEEKTDDVKTVNDYYTTIDSNKDDIYASLYFAGYGNDEKASNMVAFREKYNMKDVKFDKVEDAYDEEWYVVIPKYQDTVIEVYHVELDDNGNLRETELLAASQKPVSICCNTSDIIPSVRVKIRYKDKVVQFEPGISLEDGCVLEFDGIETIE